MSIETPMSSTKITFVTAFIDLYEDDRQHVRTSDNYVSLFKQLASSGISICLYVSSSYELIGLDLQKQFPNVVLMRILELKDTETYKIIMDHNPEIPIVSNIKKDTKNYMILMNSKSEFVYKASIVNPFNTNHFAWIDFGICHILRNPQKTLTDLFNLSNTQLIDKLLVFPSCWTKNESLNIINKNKQLLTTNIQWRFCGGFYIGDKDSLKDMYLLVKNELPNYIKHSGTNIINWEVNTWLWLEQDCGWNIETYKSDHNDSILNVPSKYILNYNSIPNIDINNLTITNFNITKYIDKVFYINLEHRTDRLKEIEAELDGFNIPYERFNAISNPDFGIVGCTKSHLEVMKIARDRKYKNILIFEDDFKFIVSKKEFEYNILKLFGSNIDTSYDTSISNETKPIDFNVCMLGYNLNKSEMCNEFPFLNKVLDAQTASAYIVNESFYNNLIELYEYAIPLLETTRQHWNYANDQIWKRLQPNSKWYCFTQRIGIQRPSYSDNTKTFCDYGT